MLFKKGVFSGKKGKKVIKLKLSCFSNYDQIKDEIKKQNEEEVRRKKEARKNARKYKNDTINDTVTGDTVELARSDGGVPDPAAVIELDRQSSSGDNNMSSVFADRIDDASGMPDFREYIDQEPNEYSEIRVKFFNAEGLSREPKARAYEHIMEKKYNSYGG